MRNLFVRLVGPLFLVCAVAACDPMAPPGPQTPTRVACASGTRVCCPVHQHPKLVGYQLVCVFKPGW